MQNETKEAENTNDEQVLKKGRHRKKQLYNSILQQMEFYFSDSNLSKDRFLSQLLSQNNYVDLNVFLKFNKIRKLTSNIENIQKAIKNSNLIELSEDRNSVCRKLPIKNKTNVDECTIYVERLKSDATHEWLSSVFAEFGSVVYVSIPKYKHNNVIKGFAFVEFDTEAEAEAALRYFESIECKMPSNIEPEQLCSIATFEGSGEEKMEDQPHSEKKRKFEEDEDNENGESKKQKVESELIDSEDTESKKKKKLKKEHKKKNYIKELGLQVLSKKEWKRMRNRYLDLQRKKMKEFKQHLFKAKYGNSNYDEKPKLSKEECNSQKISPPKYDMSEGLIVKIKLSEPISDLKKFKNDLKSSSADIAYVDVPNVGTEHVYVRFSNKNGATKFCEQDSFGKVQLLVGEDEQVYWEKIQQVRQQRFNKDKKKMRGRDKLLKKAKHTKFDE